MLRKSALILAALALPLAACGGDGDDALADRAEDNAEMMADNLEAMAENTTDPAMAANLEAQADRVEEAGEAKAEAIDDSDVDADALTTQQKNELTAAPK